MFEQYNPILVTAALSSGILLYQPAMIEGIVIGSVVFLIVYYIVNNLLARYNLDNFLTILSSSFISIMAVFYLLKQESNYMVAIGAIYLFLAIFLSVKSLDSIIKLKQGG